MVSAIHHHHLEIQENHMINTQTEVVEKASHCQSKQRLSSFSAKLTKKVSLKNRQGTKTRQKMGTTDSRVENDIAIVNLQEALARHEDSKSEKYMGRAGPTIGMQHMSFHTDTMIVIFIASGGILMLLYLIYSCLKTWKLCPRSLTDVLSHQSDIRYRGRMR